MPKSLNHISARTKIPAKIIISGEHAVVSGAPALACTVNHYLHGYAEYRATPSALQINIISQQLQTDRKTSTNKKHYLPFCQLQSHLEKIQHRGRLLQQRYHDFLNKNMDIRQVLTEKHDLIVYTIYLFFEKINTPSQGSIDLHLKNDTPVASGMGSSALVITSTLTLLNQLFPHTLNPATLVQLALQAENLQHGNSSGLDINLALNPGVLWLQNNLYHRLKIALPTCYMVNTGKSATSTGQCVNHSQAIFTTQPKLLTDFEKISIATRQALEQSDIQAWQQAIMANHCLLKQLGVVPPRAAQFIDTLAQENIAAKICGAGNCAHTLAPSVSIQEQGAGVLLAVCQTSAQLHTLQTLCDTYNYSLQPLTADKKSQRKYSYKAEKVHD